MSMIKVFSWSVAPDLFWIECSECGPVELVPVTMKETACIAHLHTHGVALAHRQENP